MATIDWDSTSLRTYEAGLDRVVLYVFGSPGIPWHGFQSIEESVDGGQPVSYYIDGVKFLNVSSYEEYAATITAINYPEEFSVCNGEASIAKGLIATQQRRHPFSLTYRTLVGSDTKALGYGYKIHMVYNALTSPSNRVHASLRNEPTMERFSWVCSVKPKPYPGVKPIAHLIIDSRKTDPEPLSVLESYLYGSDDNDPMLLDPGQIAAILEGEEVAYTDGD